MTVPLVPTLVAIVALLGCRAFFSSSETVLFSLSREWLAEAAETDRRAAALADVLEDPHRLLVTLLVGNNVVIVSSLLYPVVAVFDLLTGAISDSIGGQQSIERTYDEIG